MGEVLKALGFRYGAFGAWAKRTRKEELRVGTGYVMRSVLEPFLIGIAGSPAHSKAAVNLFNGLAREHSRKMQHDGPVGRTAEASWARVVRWNCPPINAVFVCRSVLYAAFGAWAVYAWAVRLLLPDAVAGN